jgi:hypothetical protein
MLVLSKRSALLQKFIDKRRLAMVDMGDDRDVANILSSAHKDAFARKRISIDSTMFVLETSKPYKLRPNRYRKYPTRGYIWYLSMNPLNNLGDT